MSKIKSLDELRQMKARLESQMDIREKSNNPEKLVQIRVAMATLGYCYAEPTIEVKRPGEDPVVFGHVNTDKAMEIIDKYVLHGDLVDGILPVNYQTIEKN